MRGTVDPTALPPRNSPVSADLRDAEQACLREFLSLLPEPVRAELARVQQVYREAVAQADHRKASLAERLATRHRERMNACRTVTEQKVAELDTRTAADLEQLKADRAHRTRAATEEADTVVHEARKARDQEVWLADSVADATRGHLAAEVRKTHEQAPVLGRQIDDLQQRVDGAMLELRQGGLLVQSQALAPVPDADAGEVYRNQTEHAEHLLDQLAGLSRPKLFTGSRVVTIPLGLGLAGASLGFLAALAMPQVLSRGLGAGIGFGLGLAVAAVLAPFLWRRASLQVKQVYGPLQEAVDAARGAAESYLARTIDQLRQREVQSAVLRQEELSRAKARHDQIAGEAIVQRDRTLTEIEEHYSTRRAAMREVYETQRAAMLKHLQECEERHTRHYEHCLKALEQRHVRQLEAAKALQAQARAQIEARWSRVLADLAEVRREVAELERGRFAGWSEPTWTNWQPPDTPTAVVPFGALHVRPNDLGDPVQPLAVGQLGSTQPFMLPALLAFPDRASLLIQAGSLGREQAIEACQAVMLRLLTTLPPGRVRFIIIDPVGLGRNFAGFMHLADDDEDLVGGRIWTDSGHIEQRLADLTAHIENVIQKYLRNEFESIEAYNAQAGELAEPYRFLVIANFPINFTDESARRLASIMASGPRCGVYTLIVQDTREPLPPGIPAEDLERVPAHVVHDGQNFVWRDPVMSRFSLRLGAPPDEELLTSLVQRVGRGRRDRRVEVPFQVIAPPAEQYWSARSESDLRVPVGRSGAVRLQSMRLGRGVAQHVLIAGKTGSGKSTLLHVMVTNLVLWYPPDEVEFYLIDFKKGVEFKTYATHAPPHARAVAIESDREFGVSVLQRLDQEMEQRGALFRRAAVQDLAAYRQSTGRPMPRCLLIVDEFQMFFAEDDKLGQDAALLLDRLVRQGRAFGIHVILGSQTLGGAAGLARSTTGQMAVRIALQCSEADSQLILDDDNLAARLLSRPGEAIYNDAGGRVEGNSPFQTAWLSDELRDRYLDQVSALARQHGTRTEPLIVFEGNEPSDLAANRLLARTIEAGPAAGELPTIWFGEAVAIKEPTGMAFRRQSGSNLLLIGQRDDAATALQAAAVVALSAHHAGRLPTKRESARLVILDGTPADAPLAGTLARLAERLPMPWTAPGRRDTEAALDQLHAELAARRDGGQTDAASVYLLVNGLQRYRLLRRQEDDFSSFMRTEGEIAKPRPDRQFVELLRDGPAFGIHVIAWCDTPASLERTLERAALREFDTRILFQMSASDSSALIDSPAANRLGFYRALLFSEEQGRLEKFRPYALPGSDLVDQAAAALSNRA